MNSNLLKTSFLAELGHLLILAEISRQERAGAPTAEATEIKARTTQDDQPAERRAERAKEVKDG